MNKAIHACREFFTTPTLVSFAIAFWIEATGATGLVIKCWTNHEGIKECGSAVPPEFVQQGHQSIDQVGNVKEVRRALTEEERVERKKQEAEQAKQDALRKEQEHKDYVLLQTYSRVEDMEKSLDDKLIVLQGNITLLEKNNKGLKEQLEINHATAAAKERAGQAVSENLRKAISVNEKQIRLNQGSIADFKGQMAALKKRYARDIARFKALKSKKNPAP